MQYNTMIKSQNGDNAQLWSRIAGTATYCVSPQGYCLHRHSVL